MVDKSEWLNVFEKNEFCCQFCFDRENSLQLFYAGKYGENVKNTPREKLKVICDECLNEELNERPEKERVLLDELRKNFTHTDIHELAEAFSYLNYYDKFQHLPEVVMSAICWAIEDENAQKNLVENYFKALKERRLRIQRTSEDIA